MFRPSRQRQKRNQQKKTELATTQQTGTPRKDEKIAEKTELATTQQTGTPSKMKKWPVPLEKMKKIGERRFSFSQHPTNQGFFYTIIGGTEAERGAGMRTLHTFLEEWWKFFSAVQDIFY